MAAHYEDCQIFVDGPCTCGGQRPAPTGQDYALKAAEARGFAAGEAAMQERAAAFIDCGGLDVCKQATWQGECIRITSGDCPHHDAQDIRALPKTVGE